MGQFQYSNIPLTHTNVVGSEENPPGSSHRKRRLLRALGWLATTALTGGTLLILGCVGFLAFLWFNDERNSAWRAIVVDDWLTRSVTITSLLLRWIVALQAAAATSMVAALLLQMGETPLPRAAAVSLAVFSNSGPHELLASLPRKSLNQISAVLCWVLIVFLASTTALLQFTSTALLSDVGIGPILNQRSANLSFGVSETVAVYEDSLVAEWADGLGYIGQRPLTFPAFAEYAEPAAPRDGVSDTGLSMRAFLPIGLQPERERTLNYSGMATILDNRVVCVRPRFSDVKAVLHGDASWVSGAVWTDETARRFQTSTFLGGRAGRVPFNCTFSTLFEPPGDDTGVPVTKEEWPVGLCGIENNEVSSREWTQTGILSEMWGDNKDPDITAFTGPVYLVINTTSTPEYWAKDSWQDSPRENMSLSQEATDASEWTALATNSSVRSLAFSLTLCSFDATSQNTNLTASRSRSSPEPVGGWITASRTYDTRAIRKQLGSNKEAASPSDRGILSLEKKDSWLHPWILSDEEQPGHRVIREKTSANLLTHAAFAGLISRNIQSPETGYYTIPTCGKCSGERGATLSRLNTAVFQDTLRETGSAALAIQGLLTTLYSMSHFDHLHQFDVAGPVHLVQEMDVTRPTGRDFFAGVMVLLCIHITLVAAVLLWFWWWTGEGDTMLVGGSWAAVARVSGPEVDWWLASSSRGTDGEVTKAMKAREAQDVMVGVTGDGERACLRRRY